MAKESIFLKENPNIDVEIGGHVNGTGKNKKKYVKLSEERANEVYYYLIAKGVDATRLSFSGYGNSELIYSAPGTAEQSQANRRVEIKVTSIN